MKTAAEVYETEIHALESAPDWQREHMSRHLLYARLRTSIHDPAYVFQQMFLRERDNCGLCRAHVRVK